MLLLSVFFGLGVVGSWRFDIAVVFSFWERFQVLARCMSERRARSRTQLTFSCGK